ncbi:single-stranded-DNA-specific exonuclease RecJ [Blautia sp. MSK.20.9]|uniref:single-stranded-DNA-specific exonuclease RecJ n=1 Tax=Blautia sp. MSK20_18 TaxID=2883186 RepID=UPI00156F2812|nr:DHH family phosphoesterase [Blautia sp. MSK20_18]MCB7508717.1 DHHA1 domain-containing protein [Blautia sp. MSK20_18]NSK12379.1 single-stranded-DNA-specific exonuclease RecJ [Blautia sp. MSK.20.9]
MSKSKWIYKNLKSPEFNVLAEKFGVHPAIIKILADRGVQGEDAVREYLEADIATVSDGSELTDMQRGVDIIYDAVKAGKYIRIMGDYDVDGVTSTYILYKGLTGLGAKCDKFIPHRITDGYGLHEPAIRDAYEAGVQVILTCDNGIAAANEIKLAKELGMTVVVTDHHEVPYEIRNFCPTDDSANAEEDGEGEVPYNEAEAGTRHYIIPDADAVIDPKRPEDDGVFKEICGAVVAWKFMGCLYKKFGKEQEFKNSDFLEIASLGTVCDVMELQHDNRAIVKEGLKKMQNTSNIGLQALLEVLGLRDKALTSYDYGFKIGPCINAEGRLDTANEAFDLLVETDYDTAIKRAEQMRDLNVERQNLTKEGMEEAFKIIDAEMQDDKVLVVYLPEAHESIAGIIAGKIRERYCKPAFVLTKGDGDFLKGSGRSIEAYSMYEKLVEVKDLMLGFGGHPMAAGLSLKEENLGKFRQELNARSGLTDADFIPKVMIDVILPVDFLTQNFIRQLEILEPFGKGNEKPVFAQSSVKANRAEIIGKNKNVLKITFNSRNCKNGVCFHDIETKEQFLNQNGKLYDFKMLYYPTLNEWNGVTSIQANVQDIC